MKNLVSAVLFVAFAALISAPPRAEAQGSAGCEILLVSASKDSVVVKAEFFTPTGVSFRMEAIYVALAYDPTTFRVLANSIMNHRFAASGFQSDSEPFLDTNQVYPDLCQYGESHPTFQNIPFPENFRVRLCTFKFIPKTTGPGTTSFMIYGNVVAPAFSGYWINTSFDNQVFSPANDLINTPWPVEFAAFNAAQQGNVVALSWTTASETGNHGFHVMRRPAEDESDEAWREIGFVAGRGDSRDQVHYMFLDGSIERDGVYEYRLKQVDFDGRYSWSGTITAEYRSSVSGYSLDPAYPNPLAQSGTAMLRYSVPERGRVRLVITNTLGQEVAVLADYTQDAGNYTASWSSRGLPAGTYIATLEASSETSPQAYRRSVRIAVTR